MYRYIGVRCPQCGAFSIWEELRVGQQAPRIGALQRVTGTCEKCNQAFNLSVENLIELDTDVSVPPEGERRNLFCESGTEIERWLVTNLKRCFTPCTVIGVLFFFVGIAVGQRNQSRFDPYLASTPNTMDLALLAANIGVMRDLLDDQVYSTGIEVPTIVYDAKAKKVRARVVVNKNLVQRPVEKVKELLSASWAKTIVSAREGFGDLSNDEFEMSFVERRINGANITWAEFAEGGYLLHSGSPYRLWSLSAPTVAHLIMDLYGTGSIATACCTRR